MCKILKFMFKGFICMFISLVAFGMVWIITHPTQHFDKVEFILERDGFIGGGIARTRLFIPIDYLGYIPDKPVIKASSFHIYATLPDINSINSSDKSDKSESIRQGKKNLSIIGILLNQARMPDNNQPLEKDYIIRMNWSKSDQPSDVKGMNLYHDNINLINPTDYEHFIYISIGTENNLTSYVICPLHLDPNPEESYCRMYDRNFNNGISADINVPKKYSKHWLIIKQKIEDKVNSFIQPEG